MQTDRHYSAEIALDFMNVHPLTDQREFTFHFKAFEVFYSLNKLAQYGVLIFPNLLKTLLMC